MKRSWRARRVPPTALEKFARRNKAALLVAGLILFFCMLLGSGIGWMFRDRVARQARVSEQIELILDEVGRLEQEQKWTEALAAAKRASAVLASGEARRRSARACPASRVGSGIGRAAGGNSPPHQCR